ncbi:MAG: type II/IV secretion system ATPase subunit [Nanoarchaeota archaeon]|nr:type II/IV secretion system ATPase subunit [Nanoarchaeota archaeon]
MVCIFDKDKIVELVREGEDNVLRINYEKTPRVPSIEDDPLCMSRSFDELIKNPSATKIVFLQKHNYEYDYAQTKILKEMANLINNLMKRKELFSYQALQYNNIANRYNEVHNVLFHLLKSDPAGCYVKVIRIIRREKILHNTSQNSYEVEQSRKYMNILDYLKQELEKTQMIQLIKTHLAGHELGDRTIYRRILSPTLKPDFMFTKLMASYPKGGEELANYNLGNTEVVIFRQQDSVQYMYHIMPPEFKITEEKYEILDAAKEILAEHTPQKQEFVDPERMREVFHNVGKDLLEELAEYRGIKIKVEEIEELAEILVRNTIGFGLIEILLADEKVQDITINSPMGQIPMFLVHGEFGECITNIIPTVSDAESWASKLRMISGRPLDEANPILDTEITIPNIASARIGVITEPLNPNGIAYAFRRHRDKPWTLPLFMKCRMMNSLAAGLLSFIIDGNRTMLIAGTRSAGKSSLLGGIMVEIMRKYRIITIEDTLELPVTQLRRLNYNIQPMKVASALSKGSSEVPADEGIRTTLRMGDSALFVGEVRSTEARALYEAMRVGALANVVAGTIHGDSPYGVFDRVVNDLDVPRTSFKATDIIVVANPIRSADGMHKWRRVTQITEVRKHWELDPMAEGGFVDLMKYNSITDQLEPTDELINGDSDALKAIAGNVKDWAGNWDAVWDNIMLRQQIKQKLVDVAEEIRNPDMLEAAFVILANDEFHKISDKIKRETDTLNSKKIFLEWNDWLRSEIRKNNLTK